MFVIKHLFSLCLGSSKLTHCHPAE